MSSAFDGRLARRLACLLSWVTAGAGSGAFHDTKQICQGHHAMLEFETTIDGTYVNGVDVITEFKVMIRPLQAIELVHARMKAMLEHLAH
jgi:hypothetical protein